MLSAGQLRNQIKLQAPASGEDALGQPTVGWNDVVTVWANIRHMSGAEAIRAGATGSTVKASIRIRFREGVTAAMRVLYGSTAYKILAVLPDGGREFVDLVCEVDS